jgi:hypothetical protein
MAIARVVGAAGGVGGGYRKRVVERQPGDDFEEDAA